LLSVFKRRVRFSPLPDPVVAVCVLAAAWFLASLAFVLVHTTSGGLTFTGAYAVYFPSDQLRYLAWIREAGLHGLIADPYAAGSAHLYLHPLLLISGLLWRAGLSVQAAYLVWTPLALGVLIWGYARFTARFLAGRERAAALALSLLFLCPLVPAFDYGGVVDNNGAYYLVTVAGHGAAYWQAWGYLPTVIALGLMPVFLLRIEALLTGHHDARDAVMSGLAGLLIAWLHPWGGIELVGLVMALIALKWTPPVLPKLVAVGVATGLPLVYYAVIAGSDSAWSLAQLRSSGNAPLLWPLLVDYTPLVLVSLVAMRRPRGVAGWIVVLWPLAALIVYLGLGLNARGTALEGITLPLAILAVLGWRRLRLAHRWSYVALFLAVVPGAFYSAHTFHDTFRDHYVPFGLAPAEQRAVVALGQMRGDVLSTGYLAVALPALDDHAGEVTSASDDLFDGRLSLAITARLIGSRRPSVVISDCLPGRADLSDLLGRFGFITRSYGCARIYQRRDQAGRIQPRHS
jgi:hypothetical protein